MKNNQRSINKIKNNHKPIKFLNKKVHKSLYIN
jgi:hypothetical protein